MNKQTETTDRSPGQRLTILYIMVLGIVALISIVSQLVVQAILTDQSTDTHVINIAGRQRMLSQKLSKAALTIEFTNDEIERTQNIKELKDVISLWERSHLGLQNGDVELNLPGNNSPEVTRMFAQLEPHYQVMIDAARQLLVAVEQDKADNITIATLIAKIMTRENNFLQQMDEIVFQYDAESTIHTEQQKLIGVILLGVVLLVLLFGGLFVFRPAVRQIEQSFSKIIHTEKELRENEARMLAISTTAQKRARELETSAEISSQITTILDIDELLQYVVDRLQNEFDFYHTLIYLLDELSGELVIAESAGEFNQQLKIRGERFTVGRGIVGIVAKTGEPFLAEDVGMVSGFIRDPLLPDTHSKLVVPLRKGDTILGVLDIHSKELGGFDKDDMPLIQSIAGQVAVAIDNAHLFQRTQAVLSEMEELNRRLTRQTWSGVGGMLETDGYIFDKSGDVVPASSTELLPAMEQAVKRKKLAQGDGNDTTTNVAIPLTLRNEVIGVVGLERDSNKEWTNEELNTIKTVGRQISLALEAARLSRETERSAWQDRVISESTAEIWSSDEVEAVMKAAVAQLGDKLQASEVIIQLSSGVELKENL